MSESEQPKTVIVKLTEVGARQIENGQPGMTFVVHRFRDNDAFVRDYRAATGSNDFIASIIYEGGYEIVTTTEVRPDLPKIDLRPGTRFLHARCLTEDKQRPLECVVTVIRKGVVYWRAAASDRSHDYFSLSQAAQYVKEVLPAAQDQAASPAAWLSNYIDCIEDPAILLSVAEKCADKLSAAQIKEIFAREMHDDGYGEPASQSAAAMAQA